ncbi:hypothetical protein M427DRAFT_157924 [Gonapodya prolifera JEL478]|uniref:Uncharacterized protein n=1 Tax=Gonapodya prolifera (strain JEL478) TaxID=1344416 RepID=A0A139A4Y1_GONPJ|nr:hypothetical protein M427DRAFT_157924 [Gonapodya prolifera JEL478]|eukprot:KXS11688.1 hypothetical protein M427DRAFT_157924 [Gonapodya prolifera JEL478]
MDSINTDTREDSAFEDSLPNEPRAGKSKSSSSGTQSKHPKHGLGSLARGFAKLFFTKKFGVHRVVGLAYLVQYVALILCYVIDYDRFFKDSWLLTTIPLTAICQTGTAILTFTFLPKKREGGYINDVGSISYFFVVENMFFVLILGWQYIYFQDRYYVFIKEHLWPLEYAFVFLTYWWRPIFPTTRISEDLGKLRKERKTYYFYLVMNHITKTFYLFGKHIIGFYLNYLRFTNAISPDSIRYVFLTSISGSFSTTIAAFLHTLRFKGYLPGWLSYTIYASSFATGGSAFLFKGWEWFTAHPWILLIVIGGALANRIPRSNRWFDAYQLGVMLLFHFGLVNTGGSWSDVGEKVRQVVQVAMKEGLAEGRMAELISDVAGVARETLKWMVWHPEGMAGKVW